MPLSKTHLLTLLNTPKIGPVTVKAVNDNANFKVTTVNDLQDLIIDTKQQNSKIHIPQIDDLLVAFDKAQSILERCDNKGIKAISVNEADYPIKFLRLPDYPIVIYIKGNISAIQSQYTAAVIGTREPSGFGLKLGRRVSGILAKNDFTIISGLAIGCDTAGHLGALDAHAPTVAVLASGVDIIYPKENQELSQRIIDGAGALLSEYEPGFRPQKSSFVERDRLQTGLSDGIVVVETDVQGGTMHAVRCAQKLNVPIGCLTGHPEALKDFPKIQGNKYLLQSGALPLGNPDQIFDFIKKMNPAATDITFYPSSKEPLPVSLTTVTSDTPITENVNTVETLEKNENIPNDSDEIQLDNDSSPIDDSQLSRIARLEQQVAEILALHQETMKLIHQLINAQDSKKKSQTPKKQSPEEKPPQPKFL